MSGCSGNAIDERIRIFADYVRNDNANFKPGESWWILNHTSESRKEYPGAISLLDQLGISPDDMEKHLTSRWIGKVGVSHYQEYLRPGKVKRFVLVTVTTSEDTENSNTSPLDQSSNVIADEKRVTRSSTPSWKLLHETIKQRCDTTTADSLIKKPKYPKEAKSSFVQGVKRILKPKTLEPEQERMRDQIALMPPDATNTHINTTKTNVSSDPILENVFITNYWQSTEAQKLFGKLEDEKTALDAIQNQIKDLKRATENPKGYKSIVVPSSDVSDLERMLESISEHQIFVVRKKCQTLILALTIATQCMAKRQNFDYCCSQAIVLAGMMGIPAAKNTRTIRNWYRLYRIHDRKIVINYVPKTNQPLEFP